MIAPCDIASDRLFITPQGEKMGEGKDKDGALQFGVERMRLWLVRRRVPRTQIPLPLPNMGPR